MQTVTDNADSAEPVHHRSRVRSTRRCELVACATWSGHAVRIRRVHVKKVKYWDKTIPLFTQGDFPTANRCRSTGISPIKVVHTAGRRRPESFANRADRLG